MRLLIGITLVALVAASFPALAAASEPIKVDVSELAAHTFAVKGSFTVDSQVPTVWKILTDYDSLGHFIPSMRSRVVKRTASNALLVAQESTTWFLAIPDTTRVLLRVQEDPGRRIDFEDVSRQDFVRYRGSWSLFATSGNTRVDYEAIAEPRFVPPLVGRAICLDTVHNLLQDLRGEILRERTRSLRAFQ